MWPYSLESIIQTFPEQRDYDVQTWWALETRHYPPYLVLHAPL